MAQDPCPKLPGSARALEPTPCQALTPAPIKHSLYQSSAPSPQAQIPQFCLQPQSPQPLPAPRDPVPDTEQWLGCREAMHATARTCTLCWSCAHHIRATGTAAHPCWAVTILATHVHACTHAQAHTHIHTVPQGYCTEPAGKRASVVVHGFGGPTPWG